MTTRFRNPTGSSQLVGCCPETPLLLIVARRRGFCQLGLVPARQAAQASLEPLIPPPRSMRRDAGLPAAASRMARGLACSAGDDSARGSGPEVWTAAR